MIDIQNIADPSAPDPIFVLAAPRSFSSLVNAMIGQHPELYGVPELNLFQCETMEEFNSGIIGDARKKSPFWPPMRHGLLRTLAQLYMGEQSIQSIRAAERWLELRDDWTTSDVFHELVEKVGPLRIVEKSPAVVRKQEFMGRMLRTFPNAKFIHLVRNPLAQCQSALKARGGVGILMAVNSIDYRGDPVQLEPQILWHDVQIQILKFLDNLEDEQFITIRGEEFLSNLDESLPALCRWLNISDGPEAIAAMRRPQDSPYSCMGPANASLGNDVNFLRSPALREGNIKSPSLNQPLPWRKDGEGFHPDVKALAAELGY